MRPPVDIHYRRNACRVTARRKADGTISVTVPYGLDPLEQSTIIDKLVERINSQPQKPRLLIVDNTIIEAPGITFTFNVDSHVPPSGIAARLHGSSIPFEASVAIGRDVDLTNGSIQKRLSDIAVRLAAMAGEPLILQPAREQPPRHPPVALGDRPWPTHPRHLPHRQKHKPLGSARIPASGTERVHNLSRTGPPNRNEPFATLPSALRQLPRRTRSHSFPSSEKLQMANIKIIIINQ